MIILIKLIIVEEELAVVVIRIKGHVVMEEDNLGQAVVQVLRVNAVPSADILKNVHGRLFVRTRRADFGQAAHHPRTNVTVIKHNRWR